MFRVFILIELWNSFSKKVAAIWSNPSLVRFYVKMLRKYVMLAKHIM